VPDNSPEALRAEVADLLRRLIMCDTSNPPGHETQAAAVIEDYAEAAGLRCRRIAKDPDRANLLVTLPGRGDGPTLGFLGHFDVVSTRREDWSVDPFAAIERDGVIWGRGTVDMKCQVAATTVALAALAREGFRPDGDIMLLLMADEEVGSAEVGSPYFVQALPDLQLDYVVGEGSGERFQTPAGPIYMLDCGVKQSASATLTVHGVPGDASLPGAGRNAGVELSRLLDRLTAYEPRTRIPPAIEPLLDVLGGPDGTAEERLARARASHPGLDRILKALTTTVIQATIAEVPSPQNQVADRAQATLACILVQETSADDLEQELREALGDGAYELEVVPPKGGRVSSPDTPLRAAIEDFLAENDPEARLVPSLAYGYSDCDMMRKAYGSIAYGFIPFRHADPMVNLMTKHGVDERVLVDDLEFQTRAALHVARAIGSLQAEGREAA
jgi:acetylornithine deacetylase/succinyl-diaminopimelate desuccinylase-like protein